MKKYVFAINMFLLLVFTSCSSITGIAKSSIETVRIGMGSESTTVDKVAIASETSTFDDASIVHYMTVHTPTYIEGTISDDILNVELCMKLPCDYSDQLVNIYKVKSANYSEIGDYFNVPGWEMIEFDNDYLSDGAYEKNGLYDYMSNEDVDRLVKSFQWESTDSIQNYKCPEEDGRSYTDYASYFEAPDSKNYDHRFVVNNEIIQNTKENRYGVYTVREELDGLPIGANYDWFMLNLRMSDNAVSRADDYACMSYYLYNGENIVKYKYFSIPLDDCEIEKKDLSVVPLEQVIDTVFKAIRLNISPKLYEQRIQIYAAELAYIPYFSVNQYGEPAINNDGKTFVNYKLYPFWVFYYQTDMSVDGFERGVVLINALTGEATNL